MGEHRHTTTVDPQRARRTHSDGPADNRAGEGADEGVGVAVDAVTRIDLTGADVRIELGELLIELADELRTHLMATVAADELTLPQAMVMRLLDRPRAMRELADEMHYDASSITALVDRLEDRGLVRRDPHPTDRRIKQVSLTAAGARAQMRTEQNFCERLPILDRLSPDQQEKLIELLTVATRRDRTPD